MVFINIPPLRDRVSDIEVLAKYFLQKYSKGKMISIPTETIRKLQKYEWPGNVRELENTIHSSLVVNASDVLEIDNIPSVINENNDSVNYLKLIDKGMSLNEVLEIVEKKIIKEALSRYNNNQSKTADYLKINRRLLYTRLKDWNL